MKCCSIKTGDLKHRIKITRQVMIADDMGGFSAEPEQQVLRQPWARVKNKSGNERYSSDKLNGVYNYEFVFRYSLTTEIRESDFVVYDNEIYNIQSIENVDEDNKYTMIMATRGVANGS